MEAVLPYMIVGMGLFAFLGGAMNWDWFMTNRKARLLVKMLGRTGARVFYIVLGLALAGFGVAALAGLVELSQ